LVDFIANSGQRRLVVGRRNRTPSGIGRMIASRGWEIRRREPASYALAANDENSADAGRERHGADPCLQTAAIVKTFAAETTETIGVRRFRFTEGKS
jgi:hypothetical protein